MDRPNDRRDSLQLLYGEQYPEGWYVLMPSQRLRRRQLLPFEAFGAKWVVARTESGAVEVVGRFCPHMGAPIHHGSIAGERIVCPFHRWEFEKGICQAIPYLQEGKIPSTARLPSRPAREQMGFIWVYNGESPSHDIPELPEASDRRFGRGFKAPIFENTHMLSVLENACDAQHFKVIHGVKFDSYRLEMTHDEEHALGFHLHMRVPLPFGRSFEQTTSIRYVGASVIYGTNTVAGFTFGRFIVSPLPIAPNRIQYNMIAFTRRIPIPGIDALVQSLGVNLLTFGAGQDYGPIWRDMDPTAGGALIKEDAHQIRFRRYYRRHLS